MTRKHCRLIRGARIGYNPWWRRFCRAEGEYLARDR